MPEIIPGYQEFLQIPFLGASVQIWLVFLIVAFVALAFFREWAAPDVVAIGALGVSFITVLNTEQLLQVFSNQAPITIACMFVLSAALERTGAIDIMGDFFERIAGKSELRVMFTLMLIAAVLSAFVNNTPVVVVFLPIVTSVAKKLGLNASRLLIPLSFASILGGTCTLTGTSTNLIIADLYSQYQPDEKAFGMFEMSKIGIIYALVGFVYLGTLGRKLLPKRKTLEESLEPPEKRSFLTQFSVEDDSPLVGKTLPETLLNEIPETEVLEVRRRGRVLQAPLDKLKVRSGDRLLITLHGTSFEDLKETEGISFGAYRNLNLKQLETRELKLMEGIVGPQSEIVGHTLREAKFRQKYGVHILAVHRMGRDLARKKDLGDVKLEFGDTLLLEGPVDAINQLQRGRNFVSLNEPRSRPPRPQKLWFGVSMVLLFIIGAAVHPPAIPAFALLAALGMILTKCIPAKDAYSSVQWNIVFLIFGMLALGKAMEVSGAAGFMASGVTGIFGTASPVVILSIIYLLSSILTEMISNNAVAALLTPIVIGIAVELQVDARPLIVAMMLGCSASFATPIGYQTNTYVYGAGGYRFSDFPKIGVPLNLTLWLVATFLVPYFWKF
tara:strand:- start:18696 stop:20537 length:1842 start_codon:yes stop_codon:yes gene_type:complete